MRIFDAEATRAGLPYPALIEALRQRFIAGCEVPARHVHAVGDGTMLIMPAWTAGGRIGVKTVNVYPGNAARGASALHATYQLFDATTGRPLALLDGDQITTRRTVAASALAASYLARADARTLLVVGAGRLAHELPLAMRAVRPGLEDIVLWCRRASQASALLGYWRAHGIDARFEPDLQAAVRAAHIVSCMTLASDPLIRGEWLRPGAHLDLMGSFTPAMREADSACLRRAAVWVDTAEAVAKAGDLVAAAAEGAFDAAQLQGTLAGLCRGICPARHSAEQITLFKSVGTALEDLAAAEWVFDGAGAAESTGVQPSRAQSRT